MKRNTSLQTHAHRRRAVVAVQVGIMMVVLIGFAALTVDVGALYNVRADLQRSADAAALAGASAFITDDMMSIRQGTADATVVTYVLTLSSDRAGEFGGMNPTFGLASTDVASSDIRIGRLNLLSAIEPLDSAVAPDALNGIEVTVRRESGVDSTNGPLQFFFAPIFGNIFGESSATAVAVFDDRVSGFNFNAALGKVAPFTMSRDAFYQDWQNGPDSYDYNEASGVIDNSPDGIREVRLYPYPLSGAGYTEGDGNFGMLNIGNVGQGTAEETAQISDGVTAAQMEAEIGTSEPTFYDDAGNPVTYTITGSPGLVASLKDDLSAKIGEVIGFFLHEGVTLSGANATYEISELRFARVMAVRLIGQPSLRGVYLQPVAYSGSDIIIDPQAPSTGGLLGRIILAR